jgi:hypothetical protein
MSHCNPAKIVSISRSNVAGALQIEVQNARPVKEPPRRVSYHLQGEYDTAIQDMLKKNVIEKFGFAMYFS